MIFEGEESLNKIKEIILNYNLVSIYSRGSVEGILISSLLTKTLQRENKNFSLSFFERISLSKNNELKNVKNTLLILDPSEEDVDNLPEEKDFIILKNKDLDNIYYLSKEINSLNKDLIYLTLFSKYCTNNLIVEAENNGKIKRVNGVNLFGSNTRSLSKAIELSYEPFLIGFSGSEENSINLLKDLEIKIKSNDIFTSLIDLDNLQLEKLTKYLALDIKKEEISKEIILLNEEEKNSPLKDINEFILFLEICILYKQYSIAVAKCLLDKQYKSRAIDIVRSYRENIIKTLSLFYTRSEKLSFIEKDNCIIINFKEGIEDSILEHSINLIQNSKFYLQKKRIIGYCYTKKDDLKFAISYDNTQIDDNIRNFIKSLPEELISKRGNNCLVFNIDVKEEVKLLELISEYLESVRIEEVKAK